MKKFLPVMVLLCLFVSIAVPISADDSDMDLPPREGYDESTEKGDRSDDYVKPDEYGEVYILADPEVELYDEDDQKGFDEDLEIPDNLVTPDEWGEVVILDNPMEGDMDGDGVPDEEDSCPTVAGEGENGCPIGDEGNGAEVIICPLDGEETEESSKGFPVTIVSIIAGIVLAAIVVVGMTVRKKK